MKMLQGTNSHGDNCV